MCPSCRVLAEKGKTCHRHPRIEHKPLPPIDEGMVPPFPVPNGTVLRYLAGNGSPGVDWTVEGAHPATNLLTEHYYVRHKGAPGCITHEEIVKGFAVVVSMPGRP